MKNSSASETNTKSSANLVIAKMVEETTTKPPPPTPSTTSAMSAHPTAYIPYAERSEEVRAYGTSYPHFGRREKKWDDVDVEGKRDGVYRIGMSYEGSLLPFEVAAKWAVHMCKLLQIMGCNIGFLKADGKWKSQWCDPNNPPMTSNEWADLVHNTKMSRRGTSCYFELNVVTDFSLHRLNFKNGTEFSHEEEELAHEHCSFLTNRNICETILSFKRACQDEVALIACSSLADNMSTAKEEFIDRLASKGFELDHDSFDFA